MHKKIAIITLHKVYNFGSVLQTYATQKIFEKHECDPVIIDYRRHQDKLRNRIFDMNWDNATSIADYLKKVLYMMLRFGSILCKEVTIGRFIRKNCSLTKKYNSFDELKEKPPIAEYYVTGSDQTWNSKYNNGIDPSYFLEFTDNPRKIAFSASIGKEKYDEEEAEITKNYLRNYKHISVREESALRLLRSIGIDNVACILDPTMQLSKDEWLPISSKRIVKEKYLLLMLLYNEDNDATKIAREIADEKGLTLVKISWELKKPMMVDKLMTHRTPEDFISLFYYADYVVTNSFHGLCFTINFGKQFVAIKRNEFNTRLECLLETFNISDRMVSVENYKEICNQEIDYKPINDILFEKRRCADDFLEKALLE